MLDAYICNKDATIKASLLFGEVCRFPRVGLCIALNFLLASSLDKFSVK